MDGLVWNALSIPSVSQSKKAGSHVTYSAKKGVASQLGALSVIAFTGWHVDYKTYRHAIQINNLTSIHGIFELERRPSSYRPKFLITTFLHCFWAVNKHTFEKRQPKDSSWNSVNPSESECLLWKGQHWIKPCVYREASYRPRRRSFEIQRSHVMHVYFGVNHLC
jgi:hypothetical protein